MSQFILLSVIISVLQVISIKSSNVYWKNVSLSQAVLASPDPAGLVDGKKFLYVCRGRQNLVNWDSVSGALDFSENGTPSCKMPNSGLKSSTKFEILISPPGATSWVPYSENGMANAIVGGPAHSGITGYVCRAIHQNSLRLGIFTMWNSAPHCWVALDDSEAPVASEIEILIINAYGRLLDKYFP